MYYVLTKEDGSFVGVSNEDATQLSLIGISLFQFQGEVPDLNRYIWNQHTLMLENTVSNISKLTFMSRFTSAERIAIQTSTDPILADAISLLQLAEFIDVTDQRVMQTVGYLSMTGILSDSRVAEILA